LLAHSSGFNSPHFGSVVYCAYLGISATVCSQLSAIGIFKARGHQLLFNPHCRREGDGEYMNSLAQKLASPSVIKFLSIGDDKGSGSFLLHGPAEYVDELGPRYHYSQGHLLVIMYRDITKTPS